MEDSPTGTRSTDRPPTAAGSYDRPGSVHPVTLLVSHLAVGVLSAVGGLALGGWIAFETGYWVTFKAWVEGVRVGALTLAAGLLVLALLVGLAVAVRSARR